MTLGDGSLAGGDFTPRFFNLALEEVGLFCYKTHTLSVLLFCGMVPLDSHPLGAFVSINQSLTERHGLSGPVFGAVDYSFHMLGKFLPL